MPAPPGRGEPVSGIAIWQGWQMNWGYNHRLNRAGSLLEQVPCRTRSQPEICRARLSVGAASGSGTDVARLESYFALVAARGVYAASAAREVVIEGFEGDVIERTARVELPRDPQLAAGPVHVAILSGFDLASLGSADKLRRLTVSVGPPDAGPGGCAVPISVTGVLGCSSMECPPRNRVDTSILVGVTVLSGGAEDLAAIPLDVGLDYAWDAQSELSPSAGILHLGSAAVGNDGSVLAIRGFSVELDDEMHLLDFGLSLNAPGREGRLPEATFLVRNWRRQMRNTRPPMSWFSYRQPGRVEWRAELVRLDFGSASVTHRLWKTEIPWRGEGKVALDAEAERVRMLHWEINP